MKPACDMIRDLLPLYQDGVCSEESKRQVDAHLQDCPACREELRLLQTSFSAPKATVKEQAVAKAAAKAWKRRRLWPMLVFYLAVALLILVFIGMMGIGWVKD